MKKLISGLVLGMMLGCGSSDVSKEESSASQKEMAHSGAGLKLTVQNSLPEEMYDSRRIKPNLNVFFCSPYPKAPAPAPRTEERCIALSGVIENGKTRSFFVTQEQLTEVYHRGNGEGSFEFMDDHQLTAITYRCYHPNDKVVLHSNLKIKQVWHVEVNQRFTFSYGCLIDRN